MRTHKSKQKLQTILQDRICWLQVQIRSTRSIRLRPYSTSGTLFLCLFNKHVHNIGRTIENKEYFTYYSCVFGKRNYRVLVRVSVCVCVCVCVCVFLHDNSKRNRSRNTKSEYIVVYENSSDEFDIELHRIKVKVTVGVQKFSPFTTVQTVRSYSSTLVQARSYRALKFDSVNSISQHWIMLGSQDSAVLYI